MADYGKNSEAHSHYYFGAPGKSFEDAPKGAPRQYPNWLVTVRYGAYQNEDFNPDLPVSAENEPWVIDRGRNAGRVKAQLDQSLRNPDKVKTGESVADKNPYGVSVPFEMEGADGETRKSTHHFAYVNSRELEEFIGRCRPVDPEAVGLGPDDPQGLGEGKFDMSSKETTKDGKPYMLFEVRAMMQAPAKHLQGEDRLNPGVKGIIPDFSNIMPSTNRLEVADAYTKQQDVIDAAFERFQHLKENGLTQNTGLRSSSKLAEAGKSLGDLMRAAPQRSFDMSVPDIEIDGDAPEFESEELEADAGDDMAL